MLLNVLQMDSKAPPVSEYHREEWYSAMHSQLEHVCRCTYLDGKGKSFKSACFLQGVCASDGHVVCYGIPRFLSDRTQWFSLCDYVSPP